MNVIKVPSFRDQTVTGF